MGCFYGSDINPIFDGHQMERLLSLWPTKPFTPFNLSLLALMNLRQLFRKGVGVGGKVQFPTAPLFCPLALSAKTL